MLQRDNTGNLEEGGLHDDVDPRTEADLLAQMDTIDDVELHLLVNNLLLDHLRQFAPNLILAEWRIKQEGRTFLSVVQHVVFLEEGEVVASHEVCFLFTQQISRLDHLLAETQVRSGHATSLLGVIDEVSLNFIVGGVTDNLDRVLVGTNSTV